MALDPDLLAAYQDSDYVVYCQSGNRSSQAAQLLEDTGLVVTDAGSMQQAASATGLPVVP